MTNSPENSDSAKLIGEIIDVAQAGNIAAASISASNSLGERSLKVDALRHTVEDAGLKVIDTFKAEPTPDKKEENWKSGMTREQILALQGLSKAARRAQLYANVNNRHKAKASKQKPVK